MRGAGVAVFAIGILLSWLTANDVTAGIVSHPRAVLGAAGVTLFAGTWLMIMGAGDSDEPLRPSATVRNGLAIASAAGYLWGATAHLHVLAFLVGY